MKKNISIMIGEIKQNDKGILTGFINGQRVFLNKVADKDGKDKWIVNQNSLAWVTDVADKEQGQAPHPQFGA